MLRRSSVHLSLGLLVSALLFPCAEPPYSSPGGQRIFDTREANIRLSSPDKTVVYSENLNAFTVQ